jgi:hypothetical protein
MLVCRIVVRMMLSCVVCCISVIVCVVRTSCMEDGSDDVSYDSRCVVYGVGI